MSLVQLDLATAPAKTRADYYREQAKEAREAADRAKDPMARDSFLLIAEGWNKLVAHCESAEEPTRVLAWNIANMDGRTGI